MQMYIPLITYIVRHLCTTYPCYIFCATCLDDFVSVLYRRRPFQVSNCDAVCELRVTAACNAPRTATAAKRGKERTTTARYRTT